MSRKIILSMHVSLDGLVAGPEGDISWFLLDDELFDFVGDITDSADTALFGRVTYEMMENYWPTADKKPDAGAHERRHAEWYRKAKKLVISRSLRYRMFANTRFISDNIATEIQRIKTDKGKDIIIFGSPSAAQELMAHNLIDSYWLFVNPFTLGEGTRLFGPKAKVNLELKDVKRFESGVLGLHYTAKR